MLRNPIRYNLVMTKKDLILKKGHLTEMEEDSGNISRVFENLIDGDKLKIDMSSLVSKSNKIPSDKERGKYFLLFDIEEDELYLVMLTPLNQVRRKSKCVNDDSFESVIHKVIPNNSVIRIMKGRTSFEFLKNTQAFLKSNPDRL